jgi:ubiquinone/menaquinone biosynthesis C-methylase UbiE
LRSRASASRGAAGGSDATSIPVGDATYDAVFDFGIIHHIPHWRTALTEVQRVLKPGGRFYAEEILAPFILHPVVRRVLRHPEADRFDSEAFGTALRQAGLQPTSSRSLGHSVAWFVAEKQVPA